MSTPKEMLKLLNNIYYFSTNCYLQQLVIAFLLFSLYLCPVYLSAQKYAYTHYNTDTNAPFDKVSTIIQDKAGYIWVGSESGLYRFDGNEFENFGIHLKSQNIHQLFTKKNSVIFINDTGLHQMNQVSHKPLLKEIIEGGIMQVDSLPFYPNDFTIYQNEIWLSQSNHSLGKYVNGYFKTYPFSKTDRPQHIEIVIAENGLVWALSLLDGLFQYDRLNDNFEKVKGIKEGNTFLIQGDYLLMGGQEVLQIYYIRNKSEPTLLRSISLKGDEVTAIHQNFKGQFLVGTQNGQLYLLSEFQSPLKTIYGANDPHRVEELDFGHIRQIYSTKDSISENGQIWICSANGLWLLKQPFFETVSNLPKNQPNSIAIGKEGETWVSINGLYDISPNKNGFKAKKIGNDIQVNAVAFQYPNNLWISVNTPKVQLIKVNNNQFQKRYSFQNRGENIFYIYPDSKKNVWFCQAPLDQPIIGLAKINTQGKVEYYEESKGFKSRVLVIKESERGEIYAAGIGAENYFYKYLPAEDKFANLSQKLPFNAPTNFEVHDIAIDNIGGVWLASSHGLLMYDSEKISPIQDQNLKQEEIRSVTALPQGGIWIATATSGLIYYEQGTSISIKEASGLPSNINAYRCLVTDQNGRIWAGTAEGLVYSRPSNATLPHSTVPHIKGIKVNFKEYHGNKAHITVKDYDHIQIDYACLDYHVNNSNYQYRLFKRAERNIILEEQEWINNDEKYSIDLSHIEAGKYYLELRSKQAGGYQWSKPLIVKMDIIKPWFKKPWFLYPFGSILFFTIAYYLRLFILRRTKKLQSLLQFQQIRLKEKQELLDQKIQEFDLHQQEYKTTISNVQMLELFIHAIPPKAGWNEIITAMGKAVDQSIDIKAFEIAFVENEELVHKGYSNKEKGGYTFRNKPFDPQTSLTSWAIANQQEVVINHFDSEHQLYIKKKDAYYYQSLVIIPFSKNKKTVALCAYSIDKHQFNENEVIMLRILVKFIIRSSSQF